MDTKAQTEEKPGEWLKKQFEFENCPECGRGARSHEVCDAFGNYFARCLPVKRRPVASIHDPRFPAMPHFGSTL